MGVRCPEMNENKNEMNKLEIFMKIEYLSQGVTKIQRK